MTVALVLLASGATSPANSQERISDKDLEKVISNLASDAERLEKDFNKAVNGSAVRRTSKEKELRQLSKTLVQQAKGMERNFKRSKKLGSWRRP